VTNKADEALKAVQESNKSFKLKKEPPIKYVEEGNYARADHFETRCKELELEVMALRREIERLMPRAEDFGDDDEGL
jgi:hypothetical protein